jgi:hypothetical protein
MTWNTVEQQDFSGSPSIDSGSPSFVLQHGGRYSVEAKATAWNSGSVSLMLLGPDGSTYIDTGADFSANGVKTEDLPPGTYKFAVTSATGVAASVTSITIEL